MKSLIGLLFFLGLGLLSAKCQTNVDAPKTYGVDTQFPGVRFDIMKIERTVQNRLMILVCIHATHDISPQGVFLGTRVIPPPHPTWQQVASGIYAPKPFSIRSTVMIDELSQQRYPTLRPVAAPGRGTLRDQTFARIGPGQSAFLNLQFAIPPPPPPPPDGSKPPQQTLSFLFPKAAGPIQHVPLPPPEAVGAHS